MRHTEAQKQGIALAVARTMKTEGSIQFDYLPRNLRGTGGFMRARIGIDEALRVAGDRCADCGRADCSHSAPVAAEEYRAHVAATKGESR